MERYSHIRMEAKRRAVDDLSGTNFDPGVAQNWAQFFVSEKSDEANSLKTDGEPGRTRTCNPLIKSPPTDIAAKEDKPVRSAKHGKVRQNPQPRRNRV
jgi:hypothetical protein